MSGRDVLGGGAPLLSASEVKEALRLGDRCAATIVRAITTRITRYDGPVSGRRHQLITLAVTGASHHFVRSLGPSPSKFDGLSDLFRRMGYGEAIEGHGLTALWASLAIAQIETGHWILEAVARQHHPASYANEINARLRVFVEQLAQEIRVGYELGCAEVAPRLHYRGLTRSSHHVAATRLLKARSAQSPETKMAVVRARAASARTWPDLGDLPAEVWPTEAAYIVDSDGVDRVVEALSGAEVAVAVSWPVLPHRLGDAARWTSLALDLAERGAIPRRRVIDCSRHRLDLWIAADPVLRDEIADVVLAPLAAETPVARWALGETLLHWLGSHDSAPALAATLGTHPQTVRYRWKRLNELFGERLRDPEEAAQMMLALRATLPTWRPRNSERPASRRR